MSTQDNGGPAFPQVGEQYSHSNDRWEVSTTDAGLTVRDYFAVHADQPGMAEIAQLAGLVWVAGRVWKDPQTSIGTFESWWSSLSFDDKLMLSARVRYAMADAMLKARAA